VLSINAVILAAVVLASCWHDNLAVSPSGHSVALFPNWVLYSHTSPVGTTEDLSSQTTKSSDHVKGQVIRVTCKVM
jgi:hypothetical protein